MILVDTSIWIDHFRRANPKLIAALESTSVSVHRFVVGELCCGNLNNPARIVSSLQALPQVVEATHEEALIFIDRQQLMGRGIGYLDVHLLAATALSVDTSLWTKDNRLRAIARELGLAFSEASA